LDFDDNVIDFNNFKNEKDIYESIEKVADDFFDFTKEYIINDDDPCICGSGKKYINCCANNNPDQPEEYYYMKLNNYLQDEETFESLKKLKTTFEILKNAIQAYPTNPLFNELAGITAAELGNIKQAKNYLMRSYRILKNDLTLDNTLFLIDILAELGEFEKIEKIGKELEGNFDNHSFYLLLTEAKFMLGKRKEGYNYVLKAYKSSNNNINVLNTVIKILIGNNFYIKALKLLKDNYSRLQEIDPMEIGDESVINIFEDTINSLFKFSPNEKYPTEPYLKYLDTLLKIFDNIDYNEKIKKDKIKTIENIIPDNDTYPIFMLKLFYNFENYQWISNNSDILFKKATPQEKTLITDLIINAVFLSGNYEKVIEYKDYLYSKQFIQTSDSKDIVSAWKNYFLSLYYLQKDREIIDFIMFIDNNVNDETLLIIHELISNVDNVESVKILDYIKNLDTSWGFNILDIDEVIDIQLTYLVYDLYLLDNPIFSEEKRKLSERLLKDYEEYNEDTFIYHYTKWLLHKSKNKDYKLSIKVIINKPIKKNFAIPLKYYVALKILGPKYVLGDFSIRKKIPQEVLKYLDTIAKIKKGEIKDLEQVFDEFSKSTEEIFTTLDAILTEKEFDQLVSN